MNRKFFILLTALVVAGCGGGGSGSSAPPAAPAPPPAPPPTVLQPAHSLAVDPIGGLLVHPAINCQSFSRSTTCATPFRDYVWLEITVKERRVLSASDPITVADVAAVILHYRSTSLLQTDGYVQISLDRNAFAMSSSVAAEVDGIWPDGRPRWRIDWGRLLDSITHPTSVPFQSPRSDIERILVGVGLGLDPNGRTVPYVTVEKRTFITRTDVFLDAKSLDGWGR